MTYGDAGKSSGEHVRPQGEVWWERLIASVGVSNRSYQSCMSFDLLVALILHRSGHRPRRQLRRRLQRSQNYRCATRAAREEDWKVSIRRRRPDPTNEEYGNGEVRKCRCVESFERGKVAEVVWLKPHIVPSRRRSALHFQRQRFNAANFITSPSQNKVQCRFKSEYEHC